MVGQQLSTNTSRKVFMIKKIFVALAIGCGLFSFTECYAAPKKFANIPNISNIKSGDVIAVQMNLMGKTQIVLVYVQNGFADYMYDGKLYPFMLRDLDKYVWAFYIKK